MVLGSHLKTVKLGNQWFMSLVSGFFAAGNNAERDSNTRHTVCVQHWVVQSNFTQSCWVYREPATTCTAHLKANKRETESQAPGDATE